MSRLIPSVVVASVLAIILAGCLHLPTANVSNTDPSHAAAPSSDPAPADENAAFGDAITYSDGVSISVSAPAEFTPSQYAAGADQAHNVVFNITITNGSDTNLEPAVYTRVSSGGVEANSVFDTDKGLVGGPTTVVLPGKTVTWKEGYSIADPADIVLQIAPSFDYDDSIFTNVE